MTTMFGYTSVAGLRKRMYALARRYAVLLRATVRPLGIIVLTRRGSCRNKSLNCCAEVLAEDVHGAARLH